MSPVVLFTTLFCHSSCLFNKSFSSFLFKFFLVRFVFFLLKSSGNLFVIKLPFLVFRLLSLLVFLHNRKLCRRIINRPFAHLSISLFLVQRLLNPFLNALPLALLLLRHDIELVLRNPIVCLVAIEGLDSTHGPDHLGLGLDFGVNGLLFGRHWYFLFDRGFTPFKLFMLLVVYRYVLRVIKFWFIFFAHR